MTATQRYESPETARLNREIEGYQRKMAALDAKHRARMAAASARRMLSQENKFAASFNLARVENVRGLLNRCPPSTALGAIMAEVAAKHGYSVLQMLTHRKLGPLARARHEAYWRAREETDLSYPQIGKAYNRDHTSIMHGIRMHEKRINQNQGV